MRWPLAVILFATTCAACVEPTTPDRPVIQATGERPCIWAGRRMKPIVCAPRRWWDSVYQVTR